MENEQVTKRRETAVRRKLQYRLRTLLLVAGLFAALLGAWFGWVGPRLKLASVRRESMSRLDWGGKDTEAEFRTNKIRDALERTNYRSISTPTLAYAAVRKGNGHLLVDWIAMDRPHEVRGIELTGNTTIQLPFDVDYIEHYEGTLIFSTAITSNEHPQAFPQLNKSGKFQASLILGGNERSNRITLRKVN